MLNRPIWLAPSVLFMTLFFVLPLLNNFWRSVSEERAENDALFYYIKLFTEPYYQEVLFQTLFLSVTVTLICLILSYPIAFFLVRQSGRWQGVVVFLLIAPLLTSVIMRTVGIQMILARRGALNALFDLLGLPLLPPGISSGSFAVYVGMVQVLVPFMVLSIAPVLQSIDRTLEDAARILGADQLKTFVEVTLPLSKNGILTGCILVFMMANGSFVTQLLLGGGKVITMPVLIFQQFNVTQEAAFAGAMGNVLLVLCLASLLLQFVLIGRSKRRAI
ncbi:ABC transporter permease [Rhizobium johnstonii]|uniref:ABC transporter permease n=1 Tax=Rhizobium TaxID=379 RepID=UPI001FEE9D05|nr:ABC transporter permease [Rhizobium leguminosarum]